MKTLPQSWYEGEFELAVIERIGDLAIAKKSYRNLPRKNKEGEIIGLEERSGKLVAYEVAYVQSRGDMLYPGSDEVSEAREFWPGDSSFGKEAWTTSTLERAQEILSRELRIEEWLKANPLSLSSSVNPKEVKSTRVHAKAALGL